MRLAATLDQDAAVESHPLDNVVWHALNTRQIQFSAGNDRARRYMVDVAPFAGMREVSPAAFASLRCNDGLRDGRHSALQTGSFRYANVLRLGEES